MYPELGEMRWDARAQGALRIFTALWVADPNGFAQRSIPLPEPLLLLELETLNYGSGGTYDATLPDEYKVDQARGLAAGLAKGSPAVRKSLFRTLGGERMRGILVEPPLWLRIVGAFGDNGVVRVAGVSLAAVPGNGLAGPSSGLLVRSPITATALSGCRTCGG